MHGNHSFCWPVLVFTLVILAGVATEATAQGWIEPIHRRPADPVVSRVHSDVTVAIDGTRRVARFEVEEVFHNRSGVMLEGDYLYPVPSGAVFTEFSHFLRQASEED